MINHCFADLKLADVILDQIIKELDSPNSGDFYEAMIFNPLQKAHNSSTRSTKIKMMQDEVWVGAFFRHYLNMINEKFYKFDLSPYHDKSKFQYTYYREGDYYQWHRDVMPEMTKKQESIRKLSYSVLLNDDYEGGDLELAYLNNVDSAEGDKPECEIFTAPKKRGTMVVFPSETMHRVTPVTKGVRKSIVGWVVGPRFV